MTQQCSLCNSESVIPLKFSKSTGKRKNRTFMRCQNCDLIFVPESFHLAPEEESARYRLHDNTLLNEGYVGMFLEKISLIHKYCLGINSVLDYGCGPEPVLSELMKKGGFGCDFYDPYFFPAFPECSYDLVISTEVFEHFRDVRAEISKIIQLLNPGGFLAIMTSFHDPIVDFESWWYLGDPTHICFFSMRTFEWVSKQFGFKIVYTNRKNFIILQALQVNLI
ncbi:Ubiquinone biosynthesis O-methyltransferase [uncultured archaeon]|nr:Ubiquinone biosynthesis O-methyltransferase [uncultured archaeon]